MKFCKQLERTIDHSDPEWTAWWINYKLLKKKIKGLPANIPNTTTPSIKKEEEDEQPLAPAPAPAAAAAANSGTSGSEPETTTEEEGGGKAPRTTRRFFCSSQEEISALSSSPEEAAFFRLLGKELRKCADFFERVEAQYEIRVAHVRDGMKLIDSDTVMAKNADSWTHMMAACVNLYKDLLRMENYCIVTWTGFSKALKKHDKRTGFCTRRHFMLKVVNKQPFTHYTRLAHMLEEVEEIYQRVQKIVKCSHFGNQSLSAEVLFIETIRDINKEVSRIQRAEDDGGHLPAKRPKKEGGGSPGGSSEKLSVLPASSSSSSPDKAS